MHSQTLFLVLLLACHGGNVAGVFPVVSATLLEMPWFHSWCILYFRSFVVLFLMGSLQESIPIGFSRSGEVQRFRGGLRVGKLQLSNIFKSGKRLELSENGEVT